MSLILSIFFLFVIFFSFFFSVPHSPRYSLCVCCICVCAMCDKINSIVSPESCCLAGDAAAAVAYAKMKRTRTRRRRRRRGRSAPPSSPRSATANTTTAQFIPSRLASCRSPFTRSHAERTDVSRPLMGLVTVRDEWTKLIGHRFLNSQICVWIGLLQAIVCIWGVAQHCHSFIYYHKVTSPIRTSVTEEDECPPQNS